MSGQSFSSTLVRELADLIMRPVTLADRVRARTHLLDWIGCAVAGAAEPAGRILLHGAGRGGMNVFALGGLGNILEMDDVDKRALLHPGPSVVPVLFSRPDTTIAGWLDALVRGYEATIRLGRAVGPGHYALWHNTGTCGPVGAAAAAASLLDLDADRTAHALALGLSQAAGFWQTRHEPASMGKQLHTAHAARAGRDAAQLAAEGFTGPLTILEGPQGFFAATCPGADPRDVVAGPRTAFLVHAVSFKPWPACRHAHAAIDAALELRARNVEWTGQAIIVETYADAVRFCDKPDPQSVIEAKFSLQHAVAVTLLSGRPSLEDFHPARIADPQTATLRARTTVMESPRFTARYPAHFGSAVRIGSDHADIEDALGDPERPLTDDALLAKYRMLTRSAGIADERAMCLAETVLRADETESARTIADDVASMLTQVAHG